MASHLQPFITNPILNSVIKPTHTAMKILKQHESVPTFQNEEARKISLLKHTRGLALQRNLLSSCILLSKYVANQQMG